MLANFLFIFEFNFEVRVLLLGLELLRLLFEGDDGEHDRIFDVDFSVCPSCSSVDFLMK